MTYNGAPVQELVVVLVRSDHILRCGRLHEECEEERSKGWLYFIISSLYQELWKKMSLFLFMNQLKTYNLVLTCWNHIVVSTKVGFKPRFVLTLKPIFFLLHHNVKYVVQYFNILYHLFFFFSRSQILFKNFS